MRLSFGQQMQMAQKQVLAPRMIQSMEILQLPIIALQERIEQEMEDNPVLDQIEPTEDSSSCEEALPIPMLPPRANANWLSATTPTTRRTFERLLNMADNLPDDYEEQSRPSRGQIEAESDRRHDAMANMVARPESLLEYLEHQLSWYDLDDQFRRYCERIIYNLDSQRLFEGAAGRPACYSPPAELNGDAQTLARSSK